MATTMELERKYEGPRVGKPLFDGLGGVRVTGTPEREELSAVYFDTADLRLLRSGITLRRRTGGHDAGWHVKLPAGRDRRWEIGVPPGRSADGVPAEFADLVLAYTRGLELLPCARIDTERQRWRLLGKRDDVLAEVVDDEVTARDLGGAGRPGPKEVVDRWHEIEVELANGPAGLLARLDERLGAAGARRADTSSKLARALRRRVPAPTRPTHQHRGARSAGDVVVDYLRRQAERLATADTRLRRDDPEAIHDLRVATRRLRSALRAFGRLVRRDRTRALVDELHWLADVLGKARDAQVRRQHLARAAHQTPPELVLGPVLAELTRRLAGPEARTKEAVLAALRSARYFALLDALDRLLADPPLTALAGGPAAHVLPGLVRRQYRRLRAATALLDNAPDGARRDDALHSVRRAVKRVRYATEVAEPVAGKPARRYRRRLRAVQGLLGDYQDSVVERAALRELGAQVHLDGNNGFTFGLLHGRSGVLARDLRRRFPKKWRRVAKRSARRWMRA